MCGVDLQVDLLFKQHQNMLKVLYSRFRLKPSGGGLRPKVLKLDGWLALMSVRPLGRTFWADISQHCWQWHLSAAVPVCSSPLFNNS